MNIENNIILQLCPSRNKIQIDQNTNIDLIKRICSYKIQQILKNFIPDNLYIVTNNGYWLKNSNSIQNKIIKEYINIDDQIFTINRHVLTFCQTDDNLRTIIHNTIYKLVKNFNRVFDLGILIGGEMYIYGKILHSFFKEKIYISDQKSIITDSILNNPSRLMSTYHLVNYDKIKLNFISYKQNSLLIANVSKSGLGPNLSEQINLIKPSIIIMIMCNKKALIQDYKLLISNYRLVNLFKYKTNFELYILKFEYINI